MLCRRMQARRWPIPQLNNHNLDHLPRHSRLLLEPRILITNSSHGCRDKTRRMAVVQSHHDRSSENSHIPHLLHATLLPPTPLLHLQSHRSTQPTIATNTPVSMPHRAQLNCQSTPTATASLIRHKMSLDLTTTKQTPNATLKPSPSPPQPHPPQTLAPHTPQAPPHPTVTAAAARTSPTWLEASTAPAKPYADPSTPQ
jgi:hypothetical protein